jgi:hypothetical protein
VADSHSFEEPETKEEDFSREEPNPGLEQGSGFIAKPYHPDPPRGDESASKKEKEEDFSKKDPVSPSGQGAPFVEKPYDPEETRETTRGDLARGLLWLLTFAIGGVLVFIGLGRLEGTVLTQSIFPSLVALAGTALGFYFGSQTAKESKKEPDAATGRTARVSAGGGGETPRKPEGQGK